MPGTCNFLGESLIFLSSFSSLNMFLVFVISVSIFLCSFYSLFVYNRITFGLPNRIRLFHDLTVLEFSVLLPIFFFMFLLGIYPKFFLDIILMSCYNVVFFFYG